MKMLLAIAICLGACQLAAAQPPPNEHPIIGKSTNQVDPVIGAWDLRIPELADDDPTRFIVTFLPENVVNIQQAFGDRSMASGHWNIKGENNEAIYDATGDVGTHYRFQDSHFRYDLSSPTLEINGIEEHLVNLVYQANDTLVGDARITMFELDGDIESSFDVNLLATRLPYPDFDQSFHAPEPAAAPMLALAALALLRYRRRC